jgi:hypothetical protein
MSKAELQERGSISTPQSISSGLVFKTRWGWEDVELPLWRVGDDLVPTFYGRDAETTMRWCDYLLAKKVRQWGFSVRTISLLTAGKVVPASNSDDARN